MVIIKKNKNTKNEWYSIKFPINCLTSMSLWRFALMWCNQELHFITIPMPSNHTNYEFIRKAHTISTFLEFSAVVPVCMHVCMYAFSAYTKLNPKPLCQNLNDILILHSVVVVFGSCQHFLKIPDWQQKFVGDTLPFWHTFDCWHIFLAITDFHNWFTSS